MARNWPEDMAAKKVKRKTGNGAARPAGTTTKKAGRPPQRLQAEAVEPNRAEIQRQLDAVAKLFYSESGPISFAVDDLEKMLVDEEGPLGTSRDPRPIRDATTRLSPLATVRSRAGLPPSASIAEDVLQLLAVVHAVLFDGVGKTAPLPMEIRLLTDLHSAVERYARTRKNGLQVAKRTVLMWKLTQTYEFLSEFWDQGETDYRQDTQLVGNNLTRTQQEALTEARRRISWLVEDELGHEGQALDDAVSLLLVDGIWIRQPGGGAVHAAAKRLALVTGIPESTLRRDREMSRLEIRRLRINSGLVGFDPEDRGFLRFVATHGRDLILKLATDLLDAREAGAPRAAP